jgi:hypothetical protein
VGADELLLRLGLIQCLLEGRRENEALEEARACVSEESTRNCPAALFLFARCQLRLGLHAEGLTSLEQIELSTVCLLYFHKITCFILSV